MVAPCGIDCGICELYLCKDNRDLYNFLLSREIPEKSLPYNGCWSIKETVLLLKKNAQHLVVLPTIDCK